MLGLTVVNLNKYEDKPEQVFTDEHSNEKYTNIRFHSSHTLEDGSTSWKPD